MSTWSLRHRVIYKVVVIICQVRCSDTLRVLQRMTLEIVVLDLMTLCEELTQIIDDALILPVTLRWIQLDFFLDLLFLLVYFHVK